MRRIILFLAFLVFLFLINLMFYFASDDYQFFLKKLKNSDEVVYVNEGIIDDRIRSNFNEPETLLIENNNQSIVEKVSIDEKQEITSEESQVILGKNYQVVLDIFSEYDLDIIQLNTNLFDITDEYPDEYYEYYSQDLTVYFFNTKTYNEIVDIFEVLEFDLPFTINKVNNFGNESFFINLNEDIQDSQVRIIINYKGVVFGLKLNKTEYTKIREKLQVLQK